MEEREIDLVEMFWQILEQWRGLLVVAVVCALFLPLCMGVKSIADNKNIADNDAPTLDNLKYNSILDTMSLYMQYRTLESDYDSSLLNQADYSKCSVVTSTYEVALGESNQSMVTLASAYEDIENNENVTSALIKVFGKEVRPQSVYDICFFTTDSSIKANAYTIFKIISPDKQDKTFISVKTFLPSNVRPESWSEVLTKALEGYSLELVKSFGTQSIKLVSMNVRESSAEEVMMLQSRKINAISAARAKYEGEYKKLSGDAKAIVNDLIGFQDDNNFGGYNITSVQSELDKRVKAGHQHKETVSITSSFTSGFTFKWIGIGVVLGLVFYVGGLFVMEVLRRTVSYGSEIDNTLGIRNYGSIYEYPYKGVKCFLHDKRIYEYRHRSTGADKIADDLVTKLKFDGEQMVYIFTLGHSSQNVSAISNCQEKILKNSQIDCEIIKIEDSVADMYDADFANKKKAFLQILKGRTTYCMLKELMVKLQAYNIELIGMEFIDVPES